MREMGLSVLVCVCVCVCVFVKHVAEHVRRGCALVCGVCNVFRLTN